MDTLTSRALPVVEQIVPSTVCVACDVCCRFPEQDSALRPYFTKEEILVAIARGISPNAFPDHAGSKIVVTPHADGYRCPTFDPQTGHCGIYEDRPLDCRLYPVAVMWDQTGSSVVMGWDSKCPFIQGNLDSPASRAYIERTVAWLDAPESIAVLLSHPQLIGAFQDDVIVLRRLADLTARLPASPRPPTLRPVTLKDRSRFETRLSTHPVPGDQLAARSFPYHAIWRDLFTYEWMELEGHVCLVASQPEGSFLALPPIGPDPCGPAMTEALAWLSERNQVTALTRIENVPACLAVGCRERGYRVTSKGPDYLYRREDLLGLHGDRYKSQRAAYNHCVKTSHPVVRPFQPDDAAACLALYRRWREGVQGDAASDLARRMAADAESAHRYGIHHAAELGLVGRVADVDGQVAAYTFGYPLIPTRTPALSAGGRACPEPGQRGQGEEATFCILFEIADRQVKGLGAYLFREFCRELHGCALINTMDDSGLDGLRRAKLASHPLRLVESFIVSPA